MKLSSLCCFFRKESGSPAKGTFSSAAHCRPISQELRLSFPSLWRHFLYKDFSHLAMSNLCQPLCCPPQNMFQSLSYSGKTFGIIFWLLTGILQAPVGTSGSPFLFQLFFIHSPITQRCQGKGGGKQLLLSSGSQCWSCLWQWQCCESCSPGTREERCRGCASNFSLYRGHTPPGKQPPPAWQGLLAGGCRNCSSD